MKVMSLMQFLQQEMEPQEPECPDAVVMRLGDFIAALEDQISDKDRLLEIREACPEPGTYAVRFLPQVPDEVECLPKRRQKGEKRLSDQ